MSNANRLRVNEIFFSLQGEADSVGWPTVFVRLTGCPLRCQYCDTEYAFHEGEWQSIDAVLAAVALHAPRFVCVTGGEPLAQKNCLSAAHAALRCGLSRVARDERRDRYQAGGPARRARRRHQDAGLGGIEAQSACRISRICARPMW